MTTTSEVLSTDEQLARYKQALEDILDPVGYLRRDLPPGAKLDGLAVVHMCKDAAIYKEIARKALTA